MSNYCNKHLTPHYKDCVGCSVCAQYTSVKKYDGYSVHSYSKKKNCTHFRDKNIEIVLYQYFEHSYNDFVWGNLECSHMTIHICTPIDLLPRQLTYLTQQYVINIFVFPKMLKTLNVGIVRLFQSRVPLPKNMVVALLGTHSCVFLLSKYILVLYLDKCVGINTVTLPKKTNNVTLDKNFNTFIDLSKNLTNVQTSNSFDKLIKLPKSVKRLDIGYRFGKIIDFNDVLLPKSLKNLSIICTHTTKIIFTESIVHLNTFHPNEYLVDNIPNSVVRWYYDNVCYEGKRLYNCHFVNGPNSIKKEYLEQ